jgi:hypothetical protein
MKTKHIKYRVGYINKLYTLKLHLALNKAKTQEEAIVEYNKIVDMINEETEEMHSKCFLGIFIFTTLIVILTLYFIYG